MILLLLLIDGIASQMMQQQQPSVTIDLGTIRGFDYPTKSGVPSEIFLGIPYAQPPKGDLRFEKPRDPLPFGNLDATKFGNICIPHTRRAIPPGTVADEDCLTINIMRPKNRQSGNLPVLVWVHGGGFEVGSAKLFNYTGFADNYIPQDIIVVSFQYRLGVHGFLSVGIPELNGNFGMFDMAKALEFIQKYIGAFGGDPKRVTVWGLSAGGCASAQLVLSPKTRDMVAGAIEMSGSAFSYWGVGTTVYENSWALIIKLNCLGLTMKQCLKARSVDQIYDAVEAIGYTTNGTLDTIKWGPTIDGDFFPSSPFVLAKEAPPKPVIAGVSDKDAGYFALLDYSKYIQNLGIPISEQSSFTREKLIALIRNLVEPQFFGAKSEEAWNLMVERYAPPGQSVGFYLNQFNLWATNLYFFTPAVDGIIARRDAGWPVYAYRFDHFNPTIWQARNMTYQEAWGSVHTNEYSYMFDMFPMTPFSMTEDDNHVKNQLVTTIASFTKSGKPIVPHMDWPTVGENLNFHIFKAQPEVQQNFYRDEYNFMSQLRSLGFDLGFLQPTAYVQAQANKSSPSQQQQQIVAQNFGK